MRSWLGAGQSCQPLRFQRSAFLQRALEGAAAASARAVLRAKQLPRADPSRDQRFMLAGRTWGRAVLRPWAPPREPGVGCGVPRPVFDSVVTSLGESSAAPSHCHGFLEHPLTGIQHRYCESWSKGIFLLQEPPWVFFSCSVR